MAAQTTQLSIPKRHRTSLIRFVELPLDLRKILVNSLMQATPSESLYRLARQISESGVAIDFDILYGLLRMLAGLYQYREEKGLSVKEIVDGFIAAVRTEVSGLFDLKNSDWAALKRDIVELLTRSKPLAITAKASDLASENERSLCPLNCRILSDIRPVFLGNPDNEPVAGIIQHTLKIAFHAEGSDLKEFFVTLDSNDVSYLQMLLYRAELKEKGLRKMMRKSGMQVLGSSEDSE